MDRACLRRAVGVALCLGGFAPAVCQSLDVHPSKVDVSPWYRHVDARVILKNTGTEPVLKPVLLHFTNDGFSVQVQPSGVASVEPNAAAVWPVRVTAVDSARLPGTVHFEAVWSSAGRSNRRAVATLSIARQADSTDKPVEASLLSSFDSIAENRPGQIYLLVTNTLDVPVSISKVDVLRPESIKELNIQEFTIAPRSMAQKQAKLEVERRVTAGKYQLVVELTAEWDAGGYHAVRTILLNKEVNVGVFFESEILKVLGVPSFLMLPGCLFLFTMQLLLTLDAFGLKNDSLIPNVPVTSPGFWIMAITFSGLFAVAYRIATSTDYLVHYGVADLRNVWLGSIGLGIAAYSIVAFVTKKKRREQVPTAQDDPIATLRKMATKHLGILGAKVEFKLNNVDLHAYLIEPIQDGQTLVWVAPKIIARWKGTGTPEAGEQQHTFEQQINNRDTPEAIAANLEKAEAGGFVDVLWETDQSMPNPYHAKVESITGYLPRELMVESK